MDQPRTRRGRPYQEQVRGGSAPRTRTRGDEPSVVRRLLKKLGIAPRARGDAVVGCDGVLPGSDRPARARGCMCENPKGPGVETSTQGPQRGNRR